MLRIRFRRALGLALLSAALTAGCSASPRVQASAAQTASTPSVALPAAEPTESLEALVPEPTSAPDPELDGPPSVWESPATGVPRPSSTAPADDLSGGAQLRAEQRILKVPLPPDQVNGEPIAAFVVMDQTVRAHMREIFARGQAQGRRASAFSKAGDSTIESPYFLSRFDSGPYNLGEYAYLHDVIAYYHGSYSRQSLAVRVGQHSWTLSNPAWADKSQCEPDEAPLACEFRQNNPSILILRLGANDAGVPKLFEKNMRAVIEYTLAQNVIPVLSTKPDQREGTEQVNDIVRRLAAEYQVPLWDFELVAQTLPNRGLGPDGVHLTGFYQHDYTLPQALQRGHAVQNLTALILLDELHHALSEP